MFVGFARTKIAFEVTFGLEINRAPKARSPENSWDLLQPHRGITHGHHLLDKPFMNDGVLQQVAN